MRARGDRPVYLPRWGLHRRGDQVVHEASAVHVALLVVLDLLQQRRRQSLGETAVDLALDDHRVDDVATVVDRNEAAHLYLASAFVDVDDGDVAAKGEGEIRRIVVVRGLETRFHSLRMIGVRGEGDLLNRLRSIGRAADVELSRLPFQILFACLEQVRGNLAGLLADLACGHRARRTGGGRRATGVRPEPVRRCVGVAFFDLHVRGGNAELLRDDLRVRRLVSLPLRLRTETRDGLSRRMNADLSRVEHLEAENVEGVRGAGADRFGEARDANAHELTACTLLRLLSAQIPVTDLPHRQLEGGLIVPAVVAPTRGRVIGELLWLDEVLEAELRRIDVQLVRGDVRQPLDHVYSFRDAERATICNASRWLIGVRGIDGDVRRLHVIGAGGDAEETGRELRRVRRGVGAAVIGQRLHTHSGDRAVLLERKLGIDVIVPCEGVRLEILHAVLDPLHGLASQERHGDRDHEPGLHGQLVAEAAAHVG